MPPIPVARYGKANQQDSLEGRAPFNGNEVRREVRLLNRIKEVNKDMPPRVASSYDLFHLEWVMHSGA